MKLLLSGDEYCCLYNDKFYVSETGLTHINRYLQAFDEVVVAFRTKHVNDSSDLGKYKYSMGNERVSFIDVPFFQGPKQFFPKYFKIKHALKGRIKDCDFAILRLPSTTAFAALHEIRHNKIPYATEIVFDCYDAVMTSDSKVHKFIWKILHEMQVSACNNALGVSCVTEKYLQQRYFPTGKNSITSHYSSIELTPDFYLSARMHPAKKIFTLVHVANQVQFNGRKGHNELIKVISELNKFEKQAEIVFIGEDYCDGMRQLKELAKSLNVDDSVIFTGYLNKTQLRKTLENADIAVLPTRAEGLPRVVIEAMALGLPCITSPVSGNPELINEDFLIGYEDIEGMVNACSKLISDKIVYEKESRDNFERSQQYSTEVLNPRRTQFYKSLIGLISK